LINENEVLHQKLQDLSDDHSKLMRDCKDYLFLKHNSGLPGSMDVYSQNQQRLLSRIEELEDLVVEVKSQQNVSDIVDLK
jgi:hypothetical protein